MDYFDTKNIFLFLVGIINLVYGLVIYFKNKKSWTNILFCAVVLSVTFWVFSMFFYRISEESIIIWAKLLYFSAALIPIAFLYFTFVFPQEKFSPNVWQKYLLPIPYIIIAAVVLWPDFFIEGVHIIKGKENEIIFNQWWHFFYGLYICGYFFWSYINLFRSYLNSSGILKIQIKYILTGTLISTIIGLTANLIMPFLNIFILNWLGQIATVIMVAFIGYAIIKHNLMNVKVIAVEALTFAIWIFILIRFLLSHNLSERLINGGLLVFLIISGVFLIRGVWKEVKTREEMETLAGELEKANVRLRKLDQAKSEFVTIASHQLRAPLAAVKGYSSMILEGSYGKVPEKIKTPLGRIFQSSDRLVRLIADFLNLSRIERGKMQYDYQKFDFKQLARLVFDEFKAASKEEGKKLDFSFEADERENFDVRADQEKIRQVLSNLLDNAIKYTRKGFVKVSLCKGSDNEKIILRVSDSGAGMNLETIARIFQKFTRAGDGVFQMHTEGVGLGLYVAQEIMKAHDGRIWAESQGLGKGSVFRVELPAKFNTPEEKQKGEEKERQRRENIANFVKGI